MPTGPGRLAERGRLGYRTLANAWPTAAGRTADNSSATWLECQNESVQKQCLHQVGNCIRWLLTQSKSAFVMVLVADGLDVKICRDIVGLSGTMECRLAQPKA